MWLASKFCNKCVLLDISVSMSQRQLMWCGRTPVSLPKMSKYGLEFFFFPPAEETGNTNKFLYCAQAAERACFPAPRLVVSSYISRNWVSGDLPVFTKGGEVGLWATSREHRAGKPWGTSVAVKEFLPAPSLRTSAVLGIQWLVQWTLTNKVYAAQSTPTGERTRNEHHLTVGMCRDCTRSWAIPKTQSLFMEHPSDKVWENSLEGPGMVVHAYNLSIQEAEANMSCITTQSQKQEKRNQYILGSS